MSTSKEQAELQNSTDGAEKEHGKHHKVHETLDHLAHKTKDAEHYLNQHAGEALHAALAKEKELEHALKHSSERARHFIDENPLLSAGIAFSAGVLLTLLLHRK